MSPHYARPLDHGCIVPRVAIRSAPSPDAVAVSELLLGETFAAVDCSGDWAWGYGRDDGYVGYVPVAALGAVSPVNHVVCAAAALLFAAPDIRSVALLRLPMGARLEVVGERGDFLETAAGFVHRRHIHALDQPEVDAAAVAGRLLGAPYLWGGRSGDGIDCSGLVQLAHALAGRVLPRDSDQQRDALAPVPDGAAPRRGDLLFTPGHVALMEDADTVIHANAYWMATTREPLAAMLARLPAGTDVAWRRP